MNDGNTAFAVNLYSYIFSHRAAEAVRHLSDQGFSAFELMMFPGHLWHGAESAPLRKELASARVDTGARFLTANMPNIDVNIAAGDPDMRTYSLALLDNPQSFQYSASSTVSAVPLPMALPLFAAGLAGLGIAARRRKKAA